LKQFLALLTPFLYPVNTFSSLSHSSFSFLLFVRLTVITLHVGLS
jgi:hypothetical protein